MFKCLPSGAFVIAGFIFSIPAYSQSLVPRSATLSSPVQGQRISVKAREQITAYNAIRSGSLELVAGERISLKNGFHVSEGASFHGRIEDVSGSGNKGSIAGLDAGFDEAALNLSTYPNPFEAGFEVSYWLPADTQVSVEIVSASGKSKHQLVKAQSQKRGLYKVKMDSRLLPSGSYLCVLNTSDVRIARQIVKK